MFQLMVVTLNICQFLWVLHKVLFLDHCYFLFASLILIQPLNNAKFIILQMTKNLLHINYSIKKLNKAVNSDLKNLINWLNANKISLNVTKSILFKPKMKTLDFDLKLELNGKNLYPAKSAKHFSIRIDEHLNWLDHINDIAIRLNRANAMLFKVREFVNIKILKSIYYVIFDCHLNYANTVWGQNFVILLMTQISYISMTQSRNQIRLLILT